MLRGLSPKGRELQDLVNESSQPFEISPLRSAQKTDEKSFTQAVDELNRVQVNMNPFSQFE